MTFNALIMKILEGPCEIGERLRGWLEAGERPKKQNPLSRRCYLMSEAQLGEYRLVLGFETLEELQKAHAFLAKNKGGKE